MKQINKGREKKYLKQLQNLASEINARVTKHEVWHGAAIGIDEHSKQLFFIKKVKDNYRSHHINLDNVKNCRVVHSEKTMTSGKNGSSTHGKIDIVFSGRQKDAPDIALEFYNADYDSISLSHELQLTDKWSGIINKLIKESGK